MNAGEIQKGRCQRPPERLCTVAYIKAKKQSLETKTAKTV